MASSMSCLYGCVYENISRFCMLKLKYFLLKYELSSILIQTSSIVMFKRNIRFFEVKFYN